MSSPSKRSKNMSFEENPKLCALCLNEECLQSDSSDESMSEPTIESTTDSETTICGLPSKETVGQLFNRLPNEVIQSILRRMSLNDLSNISITNKWFRDFIVQHFIESTTGLPTLLGNSYRSTDAKTPLQKGHRLQVFFRLGLLLKRISCLYPTQNRIELLVKVFQRLDGIPEKSSNPLENQNMRFVFQCYGQLINHFVSGWDDSELKPVFKTLQSITGMDDKIRNIRQNPIGARISEEYYIRCFYRMVCFDPNRPPLHSDKSSDDNRLFWLKSVLKNRSLQLKAKLLLIIFGPLISQSPIPSSTPYIGYWDLTDTFFIDSGLDELGEAIRVLYTHSNTIQKQNSVISLMEAIMKIPTNWLQENVASLLYYAGDDITFDYFSSQLKNVAQKLVFLTLVSYKLTKETKNVFRMIEELATTEHRINLYNEIKVAFCEAVSDIENAIELEDERDVCEVHEMIEANNDLLMNFMVRPSPDSSQELTDSQSPKQSSKELQTIELSRSEE